MKLYSGSIRFKPVIFIFFFIPTVCFAQSGYLKIKKESFRESYEFPIVSSSYKKVQTKINTYLQLAELEILKGKERKNIFEKVSGYKLGIYGGKVNMDYTIHSNFSRNLSIGFSQSSCGATCAYWFNYYNFNPQNGERYFLNDFFSPSHFRIFKNLVAAKRIHALRPQFKALKNSGSGLDDFENTIYGYIREDDLSEFYFTKDSIFFDNMTLLYKNDMFYELDHKSSISIKSIQGLLNSYGKAALITGINLAAYKSKVDPQLYEGSINGQYSFFLLFRQSYEENFVGIYAYKAYGAGINLNGELKDKKYFFKESSDKKEEENEITFIKENGFLRGVWKGGGKKQFNFVARRF